jgi:hypothetical protein
MVTAAFEAEAAGDDDEWQDLVAAVFCDITGETIDDKRREGLAAEGAGQDQRHEASSRRRRSKTRRSRA